MNNLLLIIGSTIVAIFMGITMTMIRLRAAEKPTSPKRILLPLLFMSTGAFMFILPEFRIAGVQVIEALTVGILFAIFLIKTTKFEVKQGEIYLIPSKAFIFLLFGLLAIRIIIKIIIGSHISFGETSGMFFLLAFGMILTWRTAMLYKYYRLKVLYRNMKKTYI